MHPGQAVRGISISAPGMSGPAGRQGPAAGAALPYRNGDIRRAFSHAAMPGKAVAHAKEVVEVLD